MKYRVKLLFVTLACLFAPLSFAKSATKNPLVGNWVNQRGSKLIISSVKNDKVKGSFITAVAKDKQCIGKAVPITGFVNGNGFSLSMDFKSCNAKSTVSLIGNIHMNQVETMFMEQESGSKSWNANVIGHDVYHKTS